MRQSLFALDHRQAGYLRRLPSAGEAPVPLGASTRHWWPALCEAGFAVMLDGGYRRSLSGERALFEFDEGLSPKEVEVLVGVRDRPERMRGVYEIHPLVGAGLVALGSRSNGTPGLTPAGLAVVSVREGRERRAA